MRAGPRAAGRPAPRGGAAGGWGGTSSRRRRAEAKGAAGGGGGRPGWEEVTEASTGAVLFAEPSAFNELVVVREYARAGATVRTLEFASSLEDADDLFQSAVAVPFRPTEVRPRRRGDEGGVGELQHAPAARRRRTPRGPPAPPPTGPRGAAGTAR